MSELGPLLVIAGPTATGKTDLSLRLAERLAGEGTEIEIVSADSRQVYRGMDIGTAKVTREARASVPHHGLDLVDPDESFSVAEFQRHALDALAGIALRGRLAVLVGGTGLYLRAVARGLPLGGDADPALRTELEVRLAAEGLPALAAELRRAAPAVAARTDLANPRRVVRAMERAQLVGDRLPEPPRGYPAAISWLGLALDPGENRRRIAARAAAQFAAGLVEETVTLRSRFGGGSRAFSAFGYREALALADGVLGPDDALQRTIARTTQFARRQRTWYRAEPGIRWADAAGDALGQALATARFLGKGGP